MWTINNEVCLRCGGCVSVCPKGALELKENIDFDKSKCISCKSCEKACPVNAIKFKE